MVMHRFVRVVMLVLAFGLLVVSFTAFSVHATSWLITVVDTGDQTQGYGTHNSIAVAGDRVYISYIYGSSIRCAIYDGYSWQKTTVETSTSGMMFADTSVAVGSDNVPHVCYTINEGLKHAYYDGSVWHSEIVDSYAWYSDIALDTNNRPHISYSSDDYDLKYAYYDGSIWHTEMVDSYGDVGRFNSIALDSNNRPHISYANYTGFTPDYRLNYAHYDGSAWSLQVVDAAYSTWATSIAVDSSDRPHISYCGGSPNFYLMHAYYSGSIWNVETVDSSGNVGMWYNSIALGTDDKIHISYYDYDHEYLKYAYYDGSWHTETVDGSSGVGKYNCLALDSSNRPHISYSGSLKYARPYIPYGTNNITIWLINQPCWSPQAGKPWMKLNDPSTAPVASMAAKVRRTDAVPGSVLVYVTWTGTTASGHTEAFGYAVQLMDPGDDLTFGPVNIADVAPLVGNYSVYIKPYVLSDNAVNTIVGGAQDYYAGYFYMIGYCDINGGNVVDGKDYVLVKKSIPSTPGSAKWMFMADVNNSNSCTVVDYQLVKTNIPTIYTPA